MRIPGRLSQCALTSAPTDEVDAWLLILDVAYTSRLVGTPAMHIACSATSCIGAAALLGCPAWHSPTRSWCRCASSPAPATSWPAGSTGRSATSGAPPTSRSTARCGRWRTTAGCTSTPVVQQRPAGQEGVHRVRRRPRRAGPLDRRAADRPRQLGDRQPHPRPGGQDPRRRIRRRRRAARPGRRAARRTRRAARHLPRLREAAVPRPERADAAARCTSTWCCAAASAPRRAPSTGSTKCATRLEENR